MKIENIELNKWYTDRHGDFTRVTTKEDDGDGVWYINYDGLELDEDNMFKAESLEGVDCDISDDDNWINGLIELAEEVTQEEVSVKFNLAEDA